MRSRSRTHRTVIGISVAVLGLTATAACSDSNSSADQTDTMISATSTNSSTGTSTISSSTVPTTTTATQAPSTTKPPKPPKITTTTTTSPSPPTVTTLVPEVPKKHLTKAQRNPKNINNARPYRKEYGPIIKAQQQVVQRTAAVMSTWPINPNDPRLLNAPMTAGTLAAEQASYVERIGNGEVLNVSQGLTSRPWVGWTNGKQATVYDCEIAGYYWVNHDTGEAVPPDNVWFASPGRRVEVGARYSMVKRDGRWLFAGAQIDREACS